MLKNTAYLTVLLQNMREKYPELIKEIIDTEDYKEVCYYSPDTKKLLVPRVPKFIADYGSDKISDYIASSKVFTVSHELGHVTGAVLVRKGFEGTPLTDFVRAVEEIVAEGISKKFREKFCQFQTTFGTLESLNYQNSWYKVILKAVPDKGTRIKIISKIRDLIDEGYFILEMAMMSKTQLKVEDEETTITDEEENEDGLQ